jgi:two-component system CheB/CheR fusion protein
LDDTFWLQPIILMSLRSMNSGLDPGRGTTMALKAMKAGAVDFIEKPVGHQRSAREHPTCARSDARHSSAVQIAGNRGDKRCKSDQPSTPDIGPSARRPPSKNIAADLGISERAVDNHRAAIMKKTGSRSLPTLIRTAIAAA